MVEDIKGSGCERKMETDEGLEGQRNRKKNWPQINSMRAQKETD